MRPLAVRARMHNTSVRMKKLLPLIGLAACSAPTVVVDTSTPTITLQGESAADRRGESADRHGEAPSGRAISQIRLEAMRSGSSVRHSATLSAVDQGTFCVRLDPSVVCAEDATVLDLPAAFGRDGLEVMFTAQAQDNAAARRSIRSAVLSTNVIDTSRPEIELIEPERDAGAKSWAPSPYSRPPQRRRCAQLPPKAAEQRLSGAHGQREPHRLYPRRRTRARHHYGAGPSRFAQRDARYR